MSQEEFKEQSSLEVENLAGDSQSLVTLQHCSIEEMMRFTEMQAMNSLEQVFDAGGFLENLLEMNRMASTDTVLTAVVRDLAYKHERIFLVELEDLLNKHGFLEKFINIKVAAWKRSMAPFAILNGSKSNLTIQGRKELTSRLIEALKRLHDLDKVEFYLKQLALRGQGEGILAVLESDEFKESLRVLMEERLKEIFRETYVNKLKKNNQAFLQHFLVGRILPLYKKALARESHVMEEDALSKVKGLLFDLLKFVDENGGNINGNEIYQALFDENKALGAMKKIFQQQEQAQQINDSRVSLLSDKFDLDKLFWGFIAKEILHYGQIKLSKAKKIREVDLWSLDPKKMADHLKTPQHLKALQALANLYDSSPDEFLEYVSKMIGYTSDSVMSNSLDQARVTEIFREYLNKVQQHIEDTIKEALAFRLNLEDQNNLARLGVDFDRADIIHQLCKYLPEIIGCRDLGKLVTWAAYPHKFRKHARNQMLQNSRHLSSFKEHFDGQYFSELPVMGMSFNEADQKYEKAFEEALFSEYDQQGKYAELVLQEYDKIKKRLDEYSRIPLRVIRHQAGMMLQLFLFDEEILASKEIDDQVRDREQLDMYMKSALEITNERPTHIRFRFMLKVGPDDQPIWEKKVVDGKDGKKSTVETLSTNLVFEADGLNNYRCKLPKDHVRSLMKDESKTRHVHQGEVYRVYPIETVSLMEADLKFTYFEAVDKGGNPILEKKTKQMRALIYTGDKKKVHPKPETSLLGSKLRGKVTSDTNRMAFIFADEADEQAFLDFFYSRNALNVVKIDHPQEGRRVVKNGSDHAQINTTTNFKLHQTFAGAVKVKLSELVRGGVRKHDALLEIMTSGLEDKLLGDLSIHSPSAHRLYRASRSWDTMWKLLFPVSVYGQKYAEMKRLGLDHGFDQKFDA